VHEEVAVESAIGEERESHVDDRLDAVGVDDVALLRLDHVLAAVQVSEFSFESAESFLECNLQRHGQVGLLALEDLVLLLLDGDHYVSCFVVWLVVGLPLEGLLVVVGHSLVKVDFQGLLLTHDLLRVALLALFPVGDDGALTLALVAMAGGLCLHSRTKLHHAGHLAVALALRTGSCALSALSVAVATQLVTLNAQLLGFACKYLLQ